MDKKQSHSIQCLSIDCLVLPFAEIVLFTKERHSTSGYVFQDYDFNDTALIHSEAFSQKLAEYVYQFHENEDSVNQETDYIVGLSPLFEKAKCNMLTYGFILDFMLNGFENLGLASVTDYLLNFPALNENEISAEQGERLERIAEPYQKVKEGTLAPDIEGINSEGQSYHLHDSQAKYVLVVFWATGCEHCHDFLKQVRKKLYINKEYELVTFAIAEDETDWRESLEEMHLSGQHFSMNSVGVARHSRITMSPKPRQLFD